MMFTCPECKAKTLVVEDGWVSCSNCSYEKGAEEAAADYCVKILDFSEMEVRSSGESPLHNCPDCSNESFVDRGQDARGKRYFCFSCGAQWSSNKIDRCERCDEMKHVKDMAGLICQDCFRGKVNSDD